MIQSGDFVKIKRNRREDLEDVLNVCIVVFVGTGVSILVNRPDEGAVLVGRGIENLKYFTVLSNLFCGLVAAIRLFFSIFLHNRIFVAPKLMAASAVSVTLIVVGAVLAPLYPDLNMYAGSNLYYHLIVPLIAIAECIIMETKEKIPFKYTFYSAAFALIYGIYYLGNILINGVGEWPYTNDWYGFLNWGWPVGIGIFAFVVLLNWGMACLLRFMNIKFDNLIKRMQQRYHKSMINEEINAQKDNGDKKEI